MFRLEGSEEATELAKRAAAKSHEKPRRKHPTTSDRDYTHNQMVILKAINAYKNETGDMFPSYIKILEIIEKNGWQRVGLSA